MGDPMKNKWLVLSNIMFIVILDYTITLGMCKYRDYILIFSLNGRWKKHAKEWSAAATILFGVLITYC